MSYEFLVALRYLRAKRRTGFISIITYISIGGVCVGTLALIVALSISNGFENEVRSRILGTFAHIKVQQYHSQPVQDPDSIAKVMESIPGVVATAPFVLNKVGISSRTVQDGVLLMGIDPKREGRVTELTTNLKFGRLDFDTATSNKGRRYPGIAMGSGLADHLRMDLGDEVTLMSLKAGEQWHPGMMPKMKRFVLTGIVECGMYEYDQNLCYVSLASAQAVYDMRSGVTGVKGRVQDIYTADTIANVIQEQLGYPYYCLDWKAQNRTLFSWMKLEKLVVFLVILLIVVVAIFNIISSLIMVVVEKTKEIGILVSMGAKRKSIRKIFMLQGVVIGLVGTFLGAVLGLIACYIQHRYHLLPLPGDIYFINAVPVHTKLWDTVVVLVAANVLCFLATLYPATRAAKLIPVDALRIG